VRIGAGLLEGAVAQGVASFKGIPYAAPPVGDDRWRSPQPVVPWSGVRRSTGYGSDCLQVLGPEPITTTPSEHCLFVNVWAPADAGTGPTVPVLVWIHGGGYVGGGSSVPFFDGTAFARRGLVVVSLNYRLGRIGFFAHPALLEAGEGPVGNYGLQDQLAALRWVHDNAPAFGGDPGRVTLMGESAGGAALLHLLTSPMVEPDLFHQAVVLSGGGRRALVTRPLTGTGSRRGRSAPTVDAAFARSHGINGHGPDALARLRELDAHALVGRQTLNRLARTRLAGGAVSGVPVVDGELVVGDPADAFLAATSRTIPVITGSTASDLPLHFPREPLDPFRWFGEDSAEARAAYHLPGRATPATRLRQLLSIGADMTMHEPAHFVAHTMRAAGQPAWTYRFTYTAESTRPGSLRQSHAGELPFLFDRLESVFGDAVTDADRAAAEAFNGYVAGFALHGAPAGEGLPPWPQAEPGRFDLMDFTPDDGPVFGPDPRPGVPLVARRHARA
jgi:para-nitrobenzyl esterase